MNVLKAGTKSKSVVRQLIRGSAEINRMREEIKILTGMVVSNLFEDELVQCQNNRQYDKLSAFSSECQWKFSIDEGFGVKLNCYSLREELQTLIPHVHIFDRSKDHIRFSSHDTELIHRNLPVLIEWLFEAHPQVSERLRPFLEVG